MFKKIILSLFIVGNLYASIEDDVDAKRFEHKKGTLIDHFSGIQWQDTKKHIKKNWEGAKRYCSNLNLDGKSDWRLPSKKEYKYLFSIKNNLEYVDSSYCWSSEKSYNDAWLSIVSSSYLGGMDYKKNYHNVRCVRGKQYYTLELVNAKINQVRNNKIYQKYNVFYKEAKKIDTISSYNKFIKTYPEAPQIKDAQTKIEAIAYAKALDQWKIQPLVNFIKEYPGSTFVKDATDDIYNFVKKKNRIVDYKWFVETYPYSKQADEAQQNSYKLAYSEAEKINTISSYNEFVNKYKGASQVQEAIKKVYNLLKEYDNISGYEWFIKTYPKAPQVKDAIANIHKLAFDEAEDIDTISAYNTFIISYPMAKEIREANELAKELERYKYTDTLPAWFRSIMPDFLADIFNGIFGIFSNDEKKSRALLIKAKQIERQGNEYSGDKQAGYVMITNRMYDLLQEEYDDTDATLRFLESEEFKDFVRTFKRVMRSMNERLDDISRYSSKILEVSKQGFSEANADRDMSEYYAKEHREWEKSMHLRDKGYE